MKKQLVVLALVFGFINCNADSSGLTAINKQFMKLSQAQRGVMSEWIYKHGMCKKNPAACYKRGFKFLKSAAGKMQVEQVLAQNFPQQITVLANSMKNKSYNRGTTTGIAQGFANDLAETALSYFDKINTAFKDQDGQRRWLVKQVYKAFLTSLLDLIKKRGKLTKKEVRAILMNVNRRFQYLFPKSDLIKQGIYTHKEYDEMHKSIQKELQYILKGY